MSPACVGNFYRAFWGSSVGFFQYMTIVGATPRSGCGVTLGGIFVKSFLKSYKWSLILLASMLLGGIVGAFWGPGASVLEPWANIFLNLLYCCVVPMIFVSLVYAISQM